MLKTKKKKLSKVRKGDEVESVFLLDSLKDTHRTAVLMRLDFASLLEIATQCRVAYGTVANWFAKGGECYEAYKQISNELTKERMKASKRLSKKFAEYAPEMLETLYRVGKRNWKSAESLLDRAGFSPIEKVQAVVDLKGDREMREAAKELRESARKIRALSGVNKIISK